MNKTAHHRVVEEAVNKAVEGTVVTDMQHLLELRGKASQESRYLRWVLKDE